MRSTSSPRRVAIIGGGPAGLCLALSLQQKGITPIVYERRNADFKEGGGFGFSPNALRIFDRLGILDRVKETGYHMEYAITVNQQGTILDKHWYGSERVYGYPCIRSWRDTLASMLKQVLADKNIQVHYNSRFEGVVTETDHDVRFLINGKLQSADILVGADGIHSSVRRYISGETQPFYGGIVAIFAHVPVKDIRYPTEDYHKALVLKGAGGVLLSVPEDKDGNVALAGIQCAYPKELSRAEWDALSKNKDQLYSFYTESYDQWNDFGKSIIDAVGKCKDGLKLWPFYQVPEMERWVSTKHRTFIVGDAAHAIHPSSGQGVNQAMEDIYTLSHMLSSVDEKVDLALASEFWHKWRQERVKQLDLLVKVVNIKRLPQAEQDRQFASISEKDIEKMVGGEESKHWLFSPDLDGDMERFLRRQRFSKTDNGVENIVENVCANTSQTVKVCAQ